MKVPTVREPLVVLTAGALLIASALAWWSLLHPHRATMGLQPPMMGMTMGAAPMTWSGLLQYLTAWIIMMAALMLPSALPMFAIYSKTSKNRVAIAAFALTYVVIWAATGIPAYLLGIAVQQIAMANRAVAAYLPYALGIAVVLAGLYQFSPLKYRCLHFCRTPLAFFLGRCLRQYVVDSR